MRTIAVLTLLRDLQGKLDRPAATLDASQAGVLIESLRAVADRGIPGPWRAEFRSTLATVQGQLEHALQRADVDDHIWRVLRDLKAAVDRVVAAQRFAHRLYDLRTRRGYSLRDLAERSGVSLPSLHRLEAGGFAPPRPETLRRLADALGVSEAELADQSAAPPEPAVERGIERAVLLERLEKLLPGLTLPELGLTDELLQLIRNLRQRRLVLLRVERDEHADALRAMAEALHGDQTDVADLRLRLLRWLSRADDQTLRALHEWIRGRQTRGEESGP